MKNNSWKYPFGTFADKHFDKNHNGKLDTTETLFRDMHLDEMRRNAEADQEKQYTNNTHATGEFDYFEPPKTVNKENDEDDSKEGLQLLVVFLVIVILTGSMGVAIALELSTVLKVMVLLCSVVVGFALLKAVRLYK